MPVDSYKYLPRLIGLIYQETRVEPRTPIPWTPLDHPLSACKIGLVTTGGLYHRGVELPFDLARERTEPTWGDPGYRSIPKDICQTELGISHLHVNNEIVREDINVLLPIHRLNALQEDGVIAGQADEHYSFMGYQGYPPDTTACREHYGPEVASRFLAQQVDCVLLTPS